MLVRSLAVAVGCVVVAGVAHADVWGYIDDKGAAHFSNYKVDERYELFFRQASTPQIKPGALPQALGGAGRNAPLAQPLAAPIGASGATPLSALSGNNTAVAPPKLAAFFEVSTGYKAVRHILRDAAKRNNVDYDLLKAVIVAESGFNPEAISPKGAVGLMQLMPPTAARYGVQADPKRGVTHKLMDPATNIGAGSRYLRDLMILFPGRLDLAVAAYNAGEGAVQRNGNQIPPYKETQNYVATVLQLYSFLKPPGWSSTLWAGAPMSAASGSRPLAWASPASAPTVGARVRVELPSPAAPGERTRDDTPVSSRVTGAIPGRGNMPAGNASSAVPGSVTSNTNTIE